MKRFLYWYRGIFVGSLMVLLLLQVNAALAQSGGGFEIATSSVDNGGGYSAGGSYWVGGAIGQPDSSSNDALTGGSYEITSGFWIVKEQNPTAIRLLSLKAAPNNVLWQPAALAAIVLLLVGLLAWRHRLRL